MKVIAVQKSIPISNDDAFVLLDIETPTPGPSDLLVKVSAVSVNPVDYKVRQGHKPEQGNRILGWDACGEVTAIGDNVQEFSVGDRVFYAGDITRPGSNSEYQLVDYRIVGKAPHSLSDVEAAALPLTSLTAWEALFDRLGIQEKQSGNILIIGGAGGVGSIAIQLLRQKTNMEIITTAGRPESQEHCLRLGAHQVVNWNNLEQNLEKLGITDIEYILNCNNTDQYWSATSNLIRPQGKVCTIVENKNPLDMGPLKLKSVTFVWELMFTRSMFQTPDMAEQSKILNQISQMVDRNQIQTTLSNVLEGMTVENFREAHAQLESGKTVGKWVIRF